MWRKEAPEIGTISQDGNLEWKNIPFVIGYLLSVYEAEEKPYQ